VIRNRRIGERVFVGATELTWKPAVATGGGARRALLMDLSVTGAGLFGPTDPWVRVNDLMVVGFNRGQAVVSVRRVSPTDEENLRYYRVEFVSMESAFEREVHEVIGRVRETSRDARADALHGKPSATLSARLERERSRRESDDAAAND